MKPKSHTQAIWELMAKPSPQKPPRQRGLQRQQAEADEVATARLRERQQKARRESQQRQSQQGDPLRTDGEDG